ncbi:MAG TPA: GNAT family N-acetyltransferase [Variovorax sp.]|nr:GNAT family N-acetyltransferase [Variovorax sp.]
MSKVKVIVVTGAPAGVVYVEEAEEHRWIRTIFLLPAFQRQGIGSALLEQLVSGARQASKPIVLRVIKVNPARSLYDRAGFEVVKEGLPTSCGSHRTRPKSLYTPSASPAASAAPRSRHCARSLVPDRANEAAPAQA